MKTEQAIKALSELIDNAPSREQSVLRLAHRQPTKETLVWQWVQSGEPLPESAEAVANYALCALVKYGAQGINTAQHYANYLSAAHAIRPTSEVISAINAKMRLALFLTMPYFVSATEIKYLNNKGKTVSAKIGKALAKILPALSEKERHQLADLLKREFAPKPPAKFLLAPADNPDLWADIYQRAADEYNLTSCMTSYEGIRAIQGYACANLLPEDKREGQMIYALAYLADDAGIPYARAIVNTRDKLFVSTYSAYAGEMEKSLHAAGYRHDAQALDGMYIFAGDDGEYAPYVDGHHAANDTYFDNKRFWQIQRYGDYDLDSTSGLAPDCGEQCECCGEHAQETYVVRDYVSFSDTFSETYVCDDCRGRHFSFVPSEGEFFPDSFVATDNRGDTIILHHHFLDNHVSIDDDWYHVDDVVYSDYHDGHIPEDSAVYLDFIDDYVNKWEIKAESEGYYNFHSDWLNQQAIEHGRHISQMQE